MSDEEKYNDLILRMQEISKFLKLSYDYLNESYRKIKNGLIINNNVFQENDYSELKNQILNKKNYIDSVIIPKLKEKINT